MTFLDALRLTEILLGFALALQSLEHLTGPARERLIFLPRLVLAVLLIAGFHTAWVLAGLLVLAVVALHAFQGPYNGGADRMSLLILLCLCAARLAPSPYWQTMAMGYLALQLILSYVMSGLVKIINPEWRNGTALREVFAYSAYPASEALRQWAQAPRLLFWMSWAIMLFEVLFPLALFTHTSLWLALVVAASFHLANACLFGLNRFFWAWLAAYPALLWFQGFIIR